MNSYTRNLSSSLSTLSGLRRLVIFGLLLLVLLFVGYVVSTERQFKKVTLITEQKNQLNTLLSELDRSDLLLLRQFDTRLSADLAELVGFVENFYLPFQKFAVLAGELGQNHDIALAEEAKPLVEELRSNIIQGVALLRFGELEEFRQLYIDRTSTLIHTFRKFVDAAKFDKTTQINELHRSIDNIKNWLWAIGAFVAGLLVLILVVFKHFDSMTASYIAKLKLKNMLVEKAQDQILILSQQIQTKLESENTELGSLLAQKTKAEIDRVQTGEPVEKNREFYDTQDPLTNLYNRRFYDTEYANEMYRARNYGRLMTVMMVDIDGIKNINDSYGQLVGDECIRHVARLLRTAIKRETDIVALYGGEEFVVLLQGASEPEGRQIAEQILEKVESSVISARGIEIRLTVSIGLASMVTRSELTARELQKRAYDALYAAKQQGRNQVVFTAAA